MRKDEFKDNAEALGKKATAEKSGSGAATATVTQIRPQPPGPRPPEPKPPFGMQSAISIRPLPSIVKTAPQTTQTSTAQEKNDE